MSRKLVFATHNAHKVDEVRAILPASVELVGPAALGCHDEIPETGETLRDNALQKVQYIHDRFGVDCFADDTGLEVEALDGAPGVYSARYAGEPADFAKNRAKLLAALTGISNRRAQFRTVVSLILNDKTYFFEGIVTGRIIAEERGVGGFGYDSVFVPDGYDKTFAELPAAVKNSISHRARAMEQLNNFLAQHP
ncbi:MAG: non-canonical purine NTP diphosphatase [Paludibacteraceae bacterium]|nr:non-canonical purine NTP diphosphatase [Paludibacteraceae bacterium]